MTPAARIKASIEVLNTIKSAFVPMDSVIGDYMRGRRYIGSKDRRYIVEFCYKAVRAQARLLWWCAHTGLDDSARSHVIAALILIQKSSDSDMSEIFNGSKYAADDLTDIEKQAITKMHGEALEHKDMPENVALEVPEAYEATLKDVYGDAYADEMKALQTEAALDLRVNIMRCGRDDALNSLKKDNIAARAHEFSPWGIRLKQKVFLSHTRAFKRKLVDIQDEGSQLIALACGAKPGMQVLDYCAGAGGKTLALTGAMVDHSKDEKRCKGRVVAMDIDGRRLEKARPRFKRSGVTDIIEVRPLDIEKNRKWLRRQKASFDVTLIDVPCSGSGTWRRNPDMRWYHYGPLLEELIKTQGEIMDKVAHSVKIGGRLVYATCSMFKEENEAQVEAFLARHDNYKLMKLQDAWDADLTCPNDGDYMRLSPYKHGTDGFFAAVLERIA